MLICKCCTIGKNAFLYCTSLKKVYLPWDISLGNNAFSGCDNITQTYFSGSSEYLTYLVNTVTTGNEKLTGGTVTAWGLDADLALRGSARSSSKIALQWDKIAAATGYIVKIEKKIGFDSEEYTELYTFNKTVTISKNITSTEITGRKSGTQYKVSVRPYKKVGNYTYYGDWFYVTVLTPLAKPVVTLSKAGTNLVRASWKPVSNAEQYLVDYWYTDHNGNVVSNSRNVCGTSDTFEVFPGTAYSFSVYAYNNTAGIYSQPSAIKKIKLAKPTLKIRITKDSGTLYKVTLSGVSDVYSYYIYGTQTPGGAEEWYRLLYDGNLLSFYVDINKQVYIGVKLTYYPIAGKDYTLTYAPKLFKVK